MKISGGTPSAGNIIKTFVPVEDFFSDVFNSQYCKNMKYNIRDTHHALLHHVLQWEQEGKVKVA